jgi:hypothetical protein
MNDATKGTRIRFPRFHFEAEQREPSGPSGVLNAITGQLALFRYQ